jgi:hypothetical protein
MKRHYEADSCSAIMARIVVGRSVGNWELGIIHCKKSQSSSPSCTYLHLSYFMSSVIEYENDGISPTIVNSIYP